MNEVAQFPSRLRAYDDAAAWLARLDRGVSAEEQAEFQRWLEEEPSRCRAFVELAVFWDEAQVLSSLSSLAPLQRPKRRSILRPGRAAAALSIAAAVVAALFLGHRFLTRTPAEAVSAGTYTAELHTVVGQRAKENLPDGSVVTLNTDTLLDVAFQAGIRVVRLRRGEALFEVAHDLRRPFDVYANGHIVQAVGTAFDVRLQRDGGVQVVVTAGTVKVSRAGNDVLPAAAASREPEPSILETTLSKGEAVSLAQVASSSAQAPAVKRLQPTDIDIKLAWQRGMLVFRGERLADVLAEFGRYTTTRFELEDSELANVRVGGYFQAGDVAGLLAALRQNFHIDSETVGRDRIALYKGPK